MSTSPPRLTSLLIAPQSTPMAESDFPLPTMPTAPVSGPVPTLLPEVTPDTLDPFLEFLGDESDADKALAVIPGLFGTSQMATYLAYRALGFTTANALTNAIRVKVGPTYERWLKDYPQLAEFELLYLPKLQKDLGRTIVRLGLYRNVMLCLTQDYKVLSKLDGDGNLEMLTPREMKYLEAIRKHYTPNDLLAMERIISPEDFKGGDQVINLTWDTREQTIKVEANSIPIPELVSGSPGPN